MKRAMVVVTLLGLTAHANAENREAWRGVFAGSLTVALGGVITYWHGENKIEEAEEALCAGGAYPNCRPSTAITQDEVERLNAKGERGETIANIGLVTTGAGIAIAGFAFYKGFIEQPRRRESAVVVTPTVSKHGAGAAVQLRW
jgi:hypothetical protein